MAISFAPATAPMRNAGRYSRNAAAAALGIAVDGVTKLIDGGVLPADLPRGAVETLASRPYLSVADGGATILRTAARTEAYDDDRQHIGVHVDMTDDELEAACLRWWRSDSKRVLELELFIVTMSTIPFAAYLVDGVVTTQQRLGEAGERVHYSGRLIGRIDANGQWRTLTEDPDWAREALARLAHGRIKVSSGGPIAYLTS